MDGKKDELARKGLMSMGMYGCVNNWTEEERRLMDQFLNDPANAERLDYGYGRIMIHPIAISRLKKEVIGKGTPEPLHTICHFVWGKDTQPIEPEVEKKLLEQCLKGGPKK